MGKTAETSTYCRKCFYDLRGIGTPSRCPECGRPFDLADPKTFRTRRPRGIWRRLRWVMYPLLLIVLAASAGVGWLWWGWHREQAAIAWMVQHRGQVNTKCIGSAWLERRMGDWSYLLERGDAVYNMDIGVGERAELSPMWRLGRLTFINLRGSGVTDRWVELLCQQLHPDELLLWQTSLTDQGLVPLGHLRGLKTLSLAHVAIGDDGLVHLKNLRELSEVHFVSTQIRGPGLIHLSDLPKLETLWLADSPVDDSSVNNLAKLTKLKELDLHRTKITPEGLAELKKALPNCRIDSDHAP